MRADPTLTRVLGEMVEDQCQAIAVRAVAREPRLTTAELLRVQRIPASAAQRLKLPAQHAFAVHTPGGDACIVGAFHGLSAPILYCLTHDAFRCEGTDRVQGSGLLNTEIPAAVAAGG